MASPTYETYKGKSGYRFNLKSGNGEIILTSESYASNSGMHRAIRSVKRNSSKESNYERKKARNGQNYFVLKSTNNQVIGTSETYSSTAKMENGIKSVKANAKKAKPAPRK